MRKQFYLNQFPIPEPNLNVNELIIEFNAKYSHFGLTYSTNQWYEYRIKDAINSWNEQKSLIDPELFDVASLAKMQRSASFWIKERAFKKMLIDSLEGELLTQARADQSYIDPKQENARQYFRSVLENKLNELKSEENSYDNRRFDFRKFMNRRAIVLHEDELLAQGPMEAAG